MKILWKYISGNIKVKVKARNENNKTVYFDFQCYVEKELDAYDKFDYIDDVALAMANLRNLHHYEIVELEELD